MDVYKTQDEIEKNLKGVTKIIDDAKDSDPEFHQELKDIFNEASEIPQATQ